MKRVRAIDMFCCAGGSSWGATAARVKIVAAFDKWELAGEVYKANFPKTKFHHADLKTVRVRELAKELGTIDLILASPECTNHSPAKGKKRGSEKSRETAFEVIRFARALKPRWIVIENVVNMRRWRRYKSFISKLRRLGYNVHEQVLNSADFSVPQQRKRLFILCDKKQMPSATPTLGGRKRTAKSFVNMNGSYDWTLVSQKGRAQATLDRADRAIEVVGSNRPFLMVYYGSDAAGGWQLLNRPLRTVTTLDRFAIVKPSAKGHRMRMLQVPELQAAMGMDGMQFPHGTRRDKIKMIGNAVCPPVMKHVVSALIKDSAE